MLKEHQVAADTLIDSAAYELAQYATASRFETLPDEVTDRAKLIVFDQLACGFVGAELPASRIITRYVHDYGGKREAVVLGSPDRCPAPLAALANGTAGHADEFDSVHATSDFLGTGHPAAIIVPAAAAIAERQFATGRDLINAVVLGYDVGSRTISVTGGLAPMMGNHGIDPGCAAFAGCGVRVRPAAGPRRAPPPVRRRVGGTAERRPQRPLWRAPTHEQGVRHRPVRVRRRHRRSDGSRRIRGQRQHLRGPRRHHRHLGRSGREDQLTKDLGTDYAVMGANFKFYSAGYPIHSSVEAVLGMKSEYGLNAEDIKRITVRMPSHPASVVNNRSMPTICLQHMVAVALVAGKLGFDEAHSSALHNDPVVLQLKSRVDLIGDPEFDRDQPQGRGAHVTIETDGQTVSRKIEHPRGHRFRKPAPTWDDVRDKYEELLVRRIGQQRFEQFYHGCVGLESVDDVNEVSSLLGAGHSS